MQYQGSNQPQCGFYRHVASLRPGEQACTSLESDWMFTWASIGRSLFKNFLQSRTIFNLISGLLNASKIYLGHSNLFFHFSMLFIHSLIQELSVSFMPATLPSSLPIWILLWVIYKSAVPNVLWNAFVVHLSSRILSLWSSYCLYPSSALDT